ncbi:MAG: hypothetical protein R3F61_18425 [Myxococcota bacterium]
MTLRFAFPALLAVAACKQAPTPVTPGLCPESGDPVVEATQGDGWGFDDGDPIQFGIPPQGGAPYAPFDLRLIGLAASDTYRVITEATRQSDQLLVGEGQYNQRFVCANVGDNAGTRFSSEFHMRFFGYEPDELAGDWVDIEISVTPEGGDPVVTTFSGPLDWVLGPMPDPI